MEATSCRVNSICSVSFEERISICQRLSDARISKALHNLSSDEKSKLGKKIDLAYFVATEKLAFTKYP